MRPDTDSYFMDMLKLVERRSTCRRRHVAAIITSASGQVLATGYNGSPTGFHHCTDAPCPGAADPPGDTRRCQAVHAEQNAILQCHRLDLAHTIYVSTTPCFTCAKMLLNTQIRRIVTWSAYTEDGALDLLLTSMRVTVEIYDATEHKLLPYVARQFRS